MQEASTGFTRNFQEISSQIGQIIAILQATRSISGRSTVTSTELSGMVARFKL